MADYNDEIYIYLHDEAGNVIGITDKYGYLVVEYEQDVWGNDLAGNFGTAINGSPILQHQTGKLWDAEAGMYSNAARWYDPRLGRFVSRSPLAPEGEEEYAFCGNDPVNWVDVNGLWEEELCYFFSLDWVPFMPQFKEWMGDEFSDFGMEHGAKPIFDSWTRVHALTGGEHPYNGYNEVCELAGDQVGTDIGWGVIGRFVRNPWGRHGSPAHQARIAEIETRFAQSGWTVIAGGSKPERMFAGRYPDLVMSKYYNGSEKVISFQVGKRNTYGNPIWRERAALNDLKASGVFHHVFYLGY